MILTGATPTVQIHPTLRCNLTCLHCYSESGPRRSERLDVDLLADAVRDAAAEGYGSVAVSGGEPLLYPDLEDLLRTAREVGMTTAITTNGTLFDEARFGPVAPLLDAVAISLDGRPEVHDRMRRQDGAWDRMVARLPLVRSLGVPFGFIVTLTPAVLDDLGWLAAFAVEQGAALLQLHPLERAGRGAALPELRPHHLELGLALVRAEQLRARWDGTLLVQIDAVTRASVAAAVSARQHEPPPRRLADAVSPLVIEETGVVVPLKHGFHRDFALGDLHKARLGRLAETWLEKTLPRYRQAVAATADPARWPAKVPVRNWYDVVSETVDLLSSRPVPLA